LKHFARPAVFCSFIIATLLFQACAVDRRLKIASDPSGADVAVDGKLIGKTPLELHFTHYGVRKIYVSLQGYKSVESNVELEPPWYGTFPFDVFSEVLFPVWRKDYHSANFALRARDAELTEAEKLALEAQLKQLEETAITNGKSLRKWAPGDALPNLDNPSNIEKTASAPSVR